MQFRLFSIAFIAIALVALTGCTSYLKSTQLPDEDILQVREDYDSPWNKAIDEHEVRKGMDATDVYFSWGRPMHRLRTGENERWIYVFDEEENQPTQVVWLFFENGKLRKWTIDRGYMEFINPTNLDLPSTSGPRKAPESGK